jgi:hypothetical protein
MSIKVNDPRFQFEGFEMYRLKPTLRLLRR